MGGLAKLRYNFQQLLSEGRRLEDVATALRHSAVCPSEYTIVDTVNCLGKRNKRNNRKQWCLKEAAARAVEDRVRHVDQQLLRCLRTHTDGKSVGFNPPVVHFF